MKRLRFPWVVMGIFILPCLGMAGDPAYQYVILKTTTPPVIDGDIGEFLSAPKINIHPNSAANCDYYLLWDDQALYGAAQCQDSQLSAQVTEHDDTGIWSDDAVEYLFDTAFDGWTMGAFAPMDDVNDYEFTQNIRNATTENKGVYGYNWNPHPVTAVRLQGALNQCQLDQGYTLEWKIRWADWGIAPPVSSQHWGLNINLFDSRCDAPFTIYDGWTTHLNNSTDLPFFCGIGWFGYPEQVLSLAWVSAQNSPILVSSRDNPVGQITFRVHGQDQLTALQVENNGTAEAGTEITQLTLWYRKGGGIFDPNLAQAMGSFSAAGTKTWSFSQAFPVGDGDAVYLTADISAAARVGATCQFSLPAHAASFLVSWPREYAALTNDKVQEIRKSSEYVLDFVPRSATELVQGTPDVLVGEIRITNQSRLDFTLLALLIGLVDLRGAALPLEGIFSALRLEKQGQIVSTLQAPFISGGQFAFSSPEQIADTAQLVLELRGDLLNAPAFRDAKLGLLTSQAMNFGSANAEAANGKVFPLLTSPLHIREPNLQSSFSNYPNPFRAEQEKTRITYYLSRPARVVLTILDLLQDQVAALADAREDPGFHEVFWDGTNQVGRKVKSGIYLMQIEVHDDAGGIERRSAKISLLR